MSLVVEVYDGEAPYDPGSLLDTLTTEEPGRSVRIAENDPGTWTVSVPRDSDDRDLLRTNRWVKFRLDGTVIRSGRIGPWTQGTIEDGEEAAESKVVSGPGCLATLRDAITYPHASTGRLARDTRWFNFAAPDYNDSAWTPAIELYEQGDPGTSLYGIDVPENWPNPSAFWIWGVAIDLGDVPPMPVGDCYFRTTVTLTEEGDYAFFITADDGYELWVDGVLLAAQTEAFIFRQTHRIDQFLDAGTHTVAIKAKNIDRPSSPATNAAGVLFSLYSTSAGELTVLELQSDSSWNCLAYPAAPPGFTPGAILDILMSEAWDRGCLWPWGNSFNASVDSNGDAWPQEVEISFRYSDTLLDVLVKLAETFVDFAADEDTIDLDMVAKGGWLVSSGVSLAEGVNLGDLQHSGDPSRVTDLLLQDAEGKLTDVSSGIAADPPDGNAPRIESFLQAGTAGSAESGVDMAEGVFAEEGAYLVKATASVEAILGAAPLADFDVFQTVELPGDDGVLATTRVTAITVVGIPGDADGEVEGTVGFAIEGVQDAA